MLVKRTVWQNKIIENFSYIQSLTGYLLVSLLCKLLGVEILFSA